MNWVYDMDAVKVHVDRLIKRSAEQLRATHDPHGRAIYTIAATLYQGLRDDLESIESEGLELIDEDES